MGTTITLPSLDTPQKTVSGWAIQLPSEFAQSVGVADGSMALLHARDGNIDIEILPPLDPEIMASVLQACDEMQETFAEMKRLGD